MGMLHTFLLQAEPVRVSPLRSTLSFLNRFGSPDFLVSSFSASASLPGSAVVAVPSKSKGGVGEISCTC